MPFLFEIYEFVYEYSFEKWLVITPFLVDRQTPPLTRHVALGPNNQQGNIHLHRKQN
jgi:hypothetical protein